MALLRSLVKFSRIRSINNSVRTFADSKLGKLIKNGNVIGKTWSSETKHLKRKYRILSTTNRIRTLLIQDKATEIEGSHAAVRIDVGLSDRHHVTVPNIHNLVKKCIHTIVNDLTRSSRDPVRSFVYGDVTFDSTIFSFAEDPATLQKYDRVAQMRDTLRVSNVNPKMPNITCPENITFNKTFRKELKHFRWMYLRRPVFVCIQSHLDLNEMEKNFVDNFLIRSVGLSTRAPRPVKQPAVPKSHTDKIIVRSDSKEKQLVIQFPYEQRLSLSESNTLKIIADFLSYGGTGSMTDLLIREKTGTSCKFIHDDNLGMLVTVDLTDLGIEKYDTIAMQVFNYLKFHRYNEDTTVLKRFKEFTVNRMIDNFADVCRSEKGTISIVQSLKLDTVKFDESDLFATADERHVLDVLLNSFERCVYWMFVELTLDVENALNLADEIFSYYHHRKIEMIRSTEMSGLLFQIPNLPFLESGPYLGQCVLIRELPTSLGWYRPTPLPTDDDFVEHKLIGDDYNDVEDVPYLILWKYISKLEFRNEFSELELMKAEAYISKGSIGSIISSQYKMSSEMIDKIERKLADLGSAAPLDFSHLDYKFQIAKDVATKKLAKKLVNQESLARSLLHTCVHNFLGNKVMPPLPLIYAGISDMTLLELTHHRLDGAASSVPKEYEGIEERTIDKKIYVSSMDRLEIDSYGLCCYLCQADLTKNQQKIVKDIFEVSLGPLVAAGHLSFDVGRYKFEDMYGFVVTAARFMTIDRIHDAITDAQFTDEQYLYFQHQLLKRRISIGITRYREVPNEESMSFDEWFQVWREKNSSQFDEIMGVTEEEEE